ncbi:hypothetical protein ACFFMR_18900 [Micromonospora andamanensis]|uniref:PASTA domain-containing protein n=1 Tax=Micromonospora andamanensis TaxID=1287068 RepID=A0ABQ4HYR2_9ACTN|nr:hypothetical protein [Micromonospora andamanensis]GIJ10736.1 hypothetical protein Van01_39500 [Micromonospora andamanensis]
MRYRITAPVPHVVSTIAGVAFNDSVGETESEAALAYFRRHGYKVEEITASTEEPSVDATPAAGAATDIPPRGAFKDTWVAYVTSEAAADKRLTLDEATALKRDELAEHVLGPKED